MPETSHGIVYPESSDHTRLWEHFQNLAESVDALIDQIPTTVAGTVTVTPSAANTTTLVTVTFPTDTFTAPPAVVVTPQAGPPGAGYDDTCWARSITATGFEMAYRRSNTASVTFSWTAVQVLT